MTDWDNHFLSGSKQAGNWYPDDPPPDIFDRISLTLAYIVGGIFALALLAGLAGYLWVRLQ